MLVQSYHLEVFAPPCAPGAERWCAKATLADDIGDALPYLNATIKGAIPKGLSVYNHAARALTWPLRVGGHTIAVRPREIAISNLVDKDAAATEMQRVVGLINHTWERRAEITPSIEMRQRLKPMEVYKLLPATNCKDCGQPTCFTFALKIIAGEVELEQCAPLFIDAYREKRDKLIALLEGAVN
ncbi:MAG: Fe-S cluster protein [Chloroflexi bacterium]|nr:Fe-S cluster protein [Chloroflexota bacterium]